MVSSEKKYIHLSKQRAGSFGISIRGGFEHGTGIFVSHIQPGSEAAITGLKVKFTFPLIKVYPVTRLSPHLYHVKYTYFIFT